MHFSHAFYGLELNLRNRVTIGIKVFENLVLIRQLISLTETFTLSRTLGDLVGQSALSPGSGSKA